VKHDARPPGIGIQQVTVSGWGISGSDRLVCNCRSHKDDDKQEQQCIRFPDWKANVEVTEEEDCPNQSEQESAIPQSFKPAWVSNVTAKVVEEPISNSHNKDDCPQPHRTLPDIGNVTEGARTNAHETMRHEKPDAGPEWTTSLQVSLLVLKVWSNWGCFIPRDFHKLLFLLGTSCQEETGVRHLIVAANIVHGQSSFYFLVGLALKVAHA